MTRSRQTNRRQFLQDSTLAAAGTLALPSIIPSSALGLNGAVAPSERLVLGAIGTGGMGRGNLGDLMSNKDVQAVAVCDCDKNNAKNGQDDVNKKYGNDDCAVYHDFRELCGRKDIDIVLVATPDHWHALASIEAIKNGKDVYCEKPLTNSVAEGKAPCRGRQEAQPHPANRHTRTLRRQRPLCLRARPQRADRQAANAANQPAVTTIPTTSKSGRGRSPCPKSPCPRTSISTCGWATRPRSRTTPTAVHFFWRFILTYGGGEMTDRGAHVIDLGQLGAGTDDTVPIEYEAKGVRGQGDYNVFWDYEFTNTYANGLKLIGTTAGPRGVKFEGTDGWIFIHVHGGALEASDKALLKSKIGENEIQLGRAGLRPE